jgi:hypothetical protein
LAFVVNFNYFICLKEGEGLERIYSLLRTSKKGKNNFNFSRMKLTALEVINSVLGYDFGC